MYTPTPRFTVSLLLMASVCLGQNPAEAPVVRSFHLANTPSARGFQEIGNMLRSVAGIRDLTTDATTSSIAVTGTPAETAAAEWILHELDQPSTLSASERQTREAAMHDYQVTGSPADVVGIFYLNQINTPQGVQELLTVLRTVCHVQRTYMNTATNSIAVRESAERLAVAGWVIHELDEVPGSQTDGIHEIKSSDPSTPVVRVLYLTERSTVRDMQETMTTLRAKLRIQYCFNFTGRRAIVVGAAADRIEQAAQIVDEFNRVATR